MAERSIRGAADRRRQLRLVAWGSAALVLSPGFSAAQDAAPAAAPVAAPQSEVLTYGAKARVREDQEVEAPREVPEAGVARLSERMGPSFSLAETMPGSVQVFSGVPYVMVRGAPPSGTRMYFDGIAVPSLFHVALGPTIVNPRLLGAMRFHPAVAPARHGRGLGAAFVADGKMLREQDGHLLDLELSLLDTSGFVQVPIDHGTVAGAFRYGNPGLIMGAIGLDARLEYFDYQLRFEREMSPTEHLLVLGLGAGDVLGDRAAPQDDIALDFHRLAVRYTRTTSSLTLGSELGLGYDTSELGQELDGKTARISPNVYVQWGRRNVQTRVGVDMEATLVSITRSASNRDPRSIIDRRNGTQSLDFTLDPQDFVDQAPLTSRPTREAFGVYTELHVEPFTRFETDLGLRSDLWFTGSDHETTVDPSARVTYHFSSAVAGHAAVALVHSAVTSPIPLPGLDDIALDRGVQSAVQSEVGVDLELDAHTRLQSALFYNRFLDVVYLELILDCEGNTDPQAAQTALPELTDALSICRQPGLPHADGETYGAELFLARDLTRDLSGFVSYTLSFSSATAQDGTRFTPQTDVRHVSNAVLQYDLGAGFGLGIRLLVRSGKMGVNTIYDVPSQRFERIEQRLPSFFRADVHASYSWHTSFARMRASLGFLNVTFSREATNRDCAFSRTLSIDCTVDYQPAIVLPNLALRAEM